MFDKVLYLFSRLILTEAKNNANSTCWGPAYQPKEPKQIEKLKVIK